ncbi:MAG: hypothetical protein AAF957_17055 [Planctomycetota bacterium]
MPITPLLLVPLLAAPQSSFADHPVAEWHTCFADARAAAAESGRPILLFQLFGRLDEERC